MSVSCGDVTCETVFASSSITYWMADLSHSPANYFRFLTIAFSADLVMSSMFRATVFLTPNRMAAQVDKFLTQCRFCADSEFTAECLLC